MSTTYTPGQINAALAEARRIATPGTRDWAHRFVAHLGLTIEDTKPIPGIYLMPTDDGPRPVLLDHDAGLWWLNDVGVLIEGLVSNQGEADGLIAARVVPAEPVELSEAEVGELWDATPGNYHWSIFDLHMKPKVSERVRDDICLTVNAALAKHGTGRAFHQSMIEDALRIGLEGTGEELSPEARQQAADAVYRALSGGDRP